MSKRLDVRGRACPIPIVELMREMRTLNKGDTLEVVANDRAFPADVTAWCKKTENALLELREDGDAHIAVVRKETA